MKTSAKGEASDCKNQDICNRSSSQYLSMYTRGLRKRIEDGVALYFPNNCIDKTVIVFSEFFKYAQESVRIFCGKFSQEIFGRLHEEIQGALCRGVRIEILMAEASEPEDHFIEKLISDKEFQNLVELRYSEKLREISHFAIFDKVRFRLEIDQKSKHAIVCASATSEETEQRAKMLHEAFGHYWNKATKCKASD